ncbi:MAG: RHS repeat-associated core domain-containing protein [Pirellulaceae bacterium]
MSLATWRLVQNRGAESSTDGTEHRYTWDAWNRLVKVEERDYTSGTPGSWSDAGTYQYDAVNRRIVKVTSETRHFYYTDRWQCLEERVGTSSSARVQYVWGSRYVDDLVLGDSDLDSNGSLETRFYGIQDANWNMVAIVDDSGTVLERYSYYPYGEAKILDDDFTPDANNLSDVANPYLFTTRRFDSESSLYYFRNRYYHSQLGRFVNRDPVAYEGSKWNLYVYVDSNPLKATDPTGLEVINLTVCVACASCIGVDVCVVAGCIGMCNEQGYWDVPGERSWNCFKKCTKTVGAPLTAVCAMLCLACGTLLLLPGA